MIDAIVIDETKPQEEEPKKRPVVLPKEMEALKNWCIRTGQSLMAWMDMINRKLVPEHVEGRIDSPDILGRKVIIAGVWMFVLLIMIPVVWSGLAPLYSAAIAPGQVILDTNKKTIQHLEGGIVSAILVREGQDVKKGDTLVRLDATTTKASYDLVKKQYISSIAAEARLMAERDKKDTVDFPQELVDQKGKDPIVDENLDNQTRLFETRRKNLEGQIAVLNQKILQADEQIKGYEAQIQSSDSQLRLLNDEISVVEKLMKSGNAVRPRLLALQRNAADIQGQKGQYMASISQAREGIEEAKKNIINVQEEFLKDLLKDLNDTQATISDLKEKMNANEDKLKRIDILAPIAGRVNDLKIHTVGGVIQPGEKLMDIVPDNDKLIVEAKVMPQDIDVVHKGLEASVRLTAYKTRKVPPVAGKVINVSGDRFNDERTGASYYLARVEVDMKDLGRLDNVHLYPGMPADVMIITGKNTVLAYLWSPISDSFNKAFREQ
ncbi:MAG: HlyD family type I secretion periplasmic adaptor subunit [Rickettsiales bacterium]